MTSIPKISNSFFGHDEEPLFSIIIPVYNTSAYLKKCIYSLIDQGKPNFEIIAIDDGSTDDSREILDTIAQCEPRLRVFSIVNGGQGLARNFGLTKARGKYILFVDSDDTVANDLLSSVNPYLSDPDIDVISFAIEFKDKTGRTIARRGPKNNFYSLGAAIFVDAMVDRNFLTSACNKVYRRSLLEDNLVTFPNLRVYEDSVFSRCVALHARKVLYLKKPLYYALVRNGSTSRNMTVESFRRAADLLSLEKEIFCKHVSDENMNAIFRAHVARFLAYLIIQAAFRVDDPKERAACLQIADEIGFAECASNGEAIALLEFRMRLQVSLAKHPSLLRAIAVILRRLKFAPY